MVEVGDSFDQYADGSYLSTHPEWHAERAPWKAEIIVNLLTRNAISPRSILDVGCGTGQVLHHVSTALPNLESAIGLEPSPDAPNQIPPGSIAERQPVALEDSDAIADVAMLIDVLEHVEDYYTLLRRLGERCQHLVLHVPLELTAMAALRPSVLGKTRTAVGHIHTFSRSTLLWTLEDAGFHVIDHDVTGAAFDGPDRDPRKPQVFVRKAINAVSPLLVERALGGCSFMVLAEPRSR
ncbi:MAG: class I SAM-dependent methyltransferase [Acidimicrobiia bacterium]|nr:class I SAM-dependent methyltransferase [Acidimicrobiia bacterium]